MRVACWRPAPPDATEPCAASEARSKPSSDSLFRQQLPLGHPQDDHPLLSALFLEAFDRLPGSVAVMVRAIFVSDTPESARLLGAAASGIANWQWPCDLGPRVQGGDEGLINISPMVSVR